MADISSVLPPPTPDAAATPEARGPGTKWAQTPAKRIRPSTGEKLRRVGGGTGRTGTPYFSETTLPRDPTFWERRGRLLDKWTRKGQACWEWTGHRNQHGYGTCTFMAHGRVTTRGAHRLQWERHHGPIERGLVIMHRCDNRACVNPAHMRLGTPQDNIADMRAKGRANISGLRNQS